MMVWKDMLVVQPRKGEQGLGRPMNVLPHFIIRKGESVVDISAIESMIGTLGFPIACVIAMFYQNNKLSEQHREESQKWTDAINNNTRVMERLVDRMDGKVSKDD